MATLKKFEELEAWPEARRLGVAIYSLTRKKEFVRDFGLRDQIRRAVVSISSNIAEGFERDGSREFIQFLSQAKGSCGEVQSQLYTALDQAYIDQGEFDSAYALVSSVSRRLASLMTYLKGTAFRGNKFPPIPQHVPKGSQPETRNQKPITP